MPRTRRIALVGHPHVVIARGNNGGEVFVDDADFESYLSTLRELVRDRLLDVSAWCLMKNELRLVATPLRLPLAQIVQRLHTSHVRRVNHRHNRTGHLFEGRFRSLVIPTDRVIDVVRWVHLWPVRSGRVRRAETYPWSSHRAWVGGDEWGDLVDVIGAVGSWGPTLQLARRAFAPAPSTPTNSPSRKSSPAWAATAISPKACWPKPVSSGAVVDGPHWPRWRDACRC